MCQLTHRGRAHAAFSSHDNGVRGKCYPPATSSSLALATPNAVQTGQDRAGECASDENGSLRQEVVCRILTARAVLPTPARDRVAICNAEITRTGTAARLRSPSVICLWP